MEELELTYLVKYLPEGLFKCKSKKIIDRYIPFESKHPVIRLRKNGKKIELTKKEPIKKNDSSYQLEQTIPLSDKECTVFSKLPAKKVVKTRYYYPFGKHTLEFDVFEEKLKGLVLADIEFSSKEEMKKFQMPEFFIKNVTQEKIFAGGVLAGKSFQNIKKVFKSLIFIEKV